MRNDQGDPEEAFEHEVTLFRARWIKALEKESRSWQGPSAMKELKSRPALAFIRNNTDWRSNELFSRIVAEIMAYKKDYEVLQQAGAQFLAEYKETQNWFKGVRRDLKKARMQAHYPELRDFLTGFAERLEHEIKRLERLGEYKKGRSHSPLTVYESFFAAHPRVGLIEKRIDLDRRLQTQAAKMFTVYLSNFKISRLTHARLIVLTYLVAGLASEDQADGQLRIIDTRRVLNVRSVYSKIV